MMIQRFPHRVRLLFQATIAVPPRRPPPPASSTAVSVTLPPTARATATTITLFPPAAAQRRHQVWEQDSRPPVSPPSLVAGSSLNLRHHSSPLYPSARHYRISNLLPQTCSLDDVVGGGSVRARFSSTSEARIHTASRSRGLTGALLPSLFSNFSRTRFQSYRWNYVGTPLDSVHRANYHVDIPKDKLTISFARSSGPGGQNVNKLNTKVDLRFNIKEANWIPDDIKERMRKLFPNRVNNEDEFMLQSQRHRTQGKNLSDAMDKLRDLILQASFVEKPRIKTEVPQHEKAKRLREKRIRSERKASRKGGHDAL